MSLSVSLKINHNRNNAINQGKEATNLSVTAVTHLCPTLCNPTDCACQASLANTSCCSSPKLLSIDSVMPSIHLILCHPLLLFPSVFPSIRVFSNESALRIRWPKYWRFIFNISPSNEHPGLICFRMDWLDLLAVQGTLKSASPIQKHQFFGALLSL